MNIRAGRRDHGRPPRGATYIQAGPFKAFAPSRHRLRERLDARGDVLCATACPHVGAPTSLGVCVFPWPDRKEDTSEHGFRRPTDAFGATVRM
jgi:hypothetical protein